jgi:hypothetical protein
MGFTYGTFDLELGERDVADCVHNTHQSPIALLVNLLPFGFHHPPLYIRLQNTSMNASSMITLVPMIGSVSHPNGGRACG